MGYLEFDETYEPPVIHGYRKIGIAEVHIDVLIEDSIYRALELTDVCELLRDKDEDNDSLYIELRSIDPVDLIELFEVAGNKYKFKVDYVEMWTNDTKTYFLTQKALDYTHLEVTDRLDEGEHRIHLDFRR